MKNRKCVILALAFAVIFLQAQEGRGQGRLTGTVVDEAGNPIEGATITLEYLGVSRKLTTTSNNKGQWGFIGLGLGVVNLRAEKEGFAPTIIELQVSGLSKNPTVKIVLKKSGAEPGVSEDIKNALLQGNELFDQKKFAEALALYQKVVNSDPKLYLVRLNIGNCLMELQENDKAIAEYQKLLEEMNSIPPEKRDKKLLAQIYAAIGEAHLRQNKLEEAQDYFIKSINIDLSDPAIAYNIAEIMMNAGKTDEAIRYYETAIKIKPDWPKAYLKLGYAWLNKRDTNKAIECFKKVAEIAPADDPDSATAKKLIKNLSGR